MNSYLLDVYFKDQKFDATGNGLVGAIKEDLSVKRITEVSFVESYFINLDISEAKMKELAENIFIDPILQDFSITKPYEKKDDGEANFSPGFLQQQKGCWLIEVHYLQGVTDNVAITSAEAIQDYEKRKLKQGEKIEWFRKYLLKGKISEEEIKKICSGMLANSMIEKFSYKKF